MFMSHGKIFSWTGTCNEVHNQLSRSWYRSHSSFAPLQFAHTSTINKFTTSSQITPQFLCKVLVIDVDSLSPSERSKRMSLVKSKDTKIELFVRKFVYKLGYRYKLHDKSLPGTPDLVFRKRKKIIFVHGCFWHRHSKTCKLTRWPKSKLVFWKSKLKRNRERDLINQKELRALGWKVLVVWECQIRETDKLTDRLQAFLEDA